jgi:hypothetical protein
MTDDRFQIPQYFGCRNADNPYSFTNKPSIANRIAFGPISAPMDFAIQLNRQTMARAEKVEDISACRMLATEAQIKGSLPQFLPEQNFGQCHCAA